MRGDPVHLLQWRSWALVGIAVIAMRPVAAQPAADTIAGPARAVAPMTAGIPRITQLVVDNDLFALRDSGPPTDRDYTHGLTVTVQWAGVPARVARLAWRWPS
nr:hypothetical protein [Gemmatimonadaceae bacterium]